MRVYGGFASPADVTDRLAPACPTNASSPASVAITWAPPVAASRAVVSKPVVWLPPIVWPAPDLAVSFLLSTAPRRFTPAGWPAPTTGWSPWPAPVPVPMATPLVLAPPSTIADVAVVGHDRSAVRRGRSLVYAAAGLAAAAVGVVAIVIR